MKKEVCRAREVNAAVNQQEVLSGLSFNWFQGEILGILGVSEHGRRAVLDLIEGSLTPVSGTFLMMDRTDERKSKIGDMSRIDIGSSLVDEMSIEENFLVLKPGKNGVLRQYKTQKQELRRYLKDFLPDIDLEEPAGELSLLQKCRVEIMKSWINGSTFFLIDRLDCESDSKEYEELKLLMDRLKRDGASFLVTSGHLIPLQICADRIAFFRSRHIIKTVENIPQNTEELKRLLSVYLPEEREKNQKQKKLGSRFCRLELNLLEGQRIQFDLHRGEITAIIDFSNKVESHINGFFGRKNSYSVRYCQESEANYDRKKENHRVSVVSFDVKDSVIDTFSFIENICLGLYERVSSFGIIRRRRMNFIQNEFEEWYRVRYPAAFDDIRRMSNKDRVAILLFRQSMINASLMLCGIPERDMDITLRIMIYEELQKFAMKGKSICVWSSNNELLEDFADRYIVLMNDKIYYDVSYNQIGRL